MGWVHVHHWGNYQLNYQAKDVTPYLHATYFHVPEFFTLYKNIACFNQQGMEKYDITSKNYFTFSDHRGISALRQLLLKKYTSQFLKAAGYEGVRQSYQTVTVPVKSIHSQ